MFRSKGFFWLASRPHAAGEWAGRRHVRHDQTGLWRSDAPREHWPDDPEQRAAFDGKYGDRRQEIVFIGQQLEPEHTHETRDRCLLDDAEMAMGMVAVTFSRNRGHVTPKRAVTITRNTQ